MQNMKEALQVRAELALWSGRKAIYQPGLKALKSKYILEQDDVNRLQRGIFSKLKRDYEEKLEKEKTEVAAAKAELDRMTELMRMADEKLSDLEERAKVYQAFWETADISGWGGGEKALLDWCKQVETCLRLVKETNLCIARLKEEQEHSFAGQDIHEQSMLLLQGQIDRLWTETEAFFAEVEKTVEVSRGKHSLRFLEIGESELARVFSRWSSLEELGRQMKAYNTLFEMEGNLQKLREQFGIVFEDLAEEGEKLLRKYDGGESHFCEKDAEESFAQESFTEERKEEPSFGGNGLFGKADLSREKERLLFGLELLNKEFEKMVAPVEKTELGKKFFGKIDNMLEEEIESINRWERMLREWQQDLKLYRKDAGNFPCALDGYDSLEQKIWQYTEEEGAEMEKACREHLRDTAERLEQVEKQIRDHKN